jgi:hypothetical protein
VLRCRWPGPTATERQVSIPARHSGRARVVALEARPPPSLGARADRWRIDCLLFDRIWKRIDRPGRKYNNQRSLTARNSARRGRPRSQAGERATRDEALRDRACLPPGARGERSFFLTLPRSDLCRTGVFFFYRSDLKPKPISPSTKFGSD